MTHNRLNFKGLYIIICYKDNSGQMVSSDITSDKKYTIDKTVGLIIL